MTESESLITQLCPTLQPHGLYGLEPARLLCPWNSLDKNTGVGCHFHFQGIFLTQGLNRGFLHCRQILYHLSHQGSPWYDDYCFPKMNIQADSYRFLWWQALHTVTIPLIYRNHIYWRFWPIILRIIDMSWRKKMIVLMSNTIWGNKFSIVVNNAQCVDLAIY